MYKGPIIYFEENTQAGEMKGSERSYSELFNWD